MTVGASPIRSNMTKCTDGGLLAQEHGTRWAVSLVAPYTPV